MNAPTASEYLLQRYGSDGDGAPRVMPEITSMQRMDVLRRYFQTDINATALLTIDELAEAFYQ